MNLYTYDNNYIFGSRYYNELAQLLTLAVNTRRGLHNSRIYINTLLRNSDTIFTTLDKKADKTEVTALVTNALSENGGSISAAVDAALARLEARQQELLIQLNAASNSAVVLITDSNAAMNQSIQTALTTLSAGNTIINSTVQSALTSLNTGSAAFNDSVQGAIQQASYELSTQQSGLMQQLNMSAYNAAILITNSNNTINNTVQSALTTLVNGNSAINNTVQSALSNLTSGNAAFNNSVQGAIQNASNSIATQQQLSLADIQAASSQIAAINITNIQNAADAITFAISDDLLKKIDYLFHMFYRTDSASIMTNYPLNPHNYNI
jgi:hypothetical protein